MNQIPSYLQDAKQLLNTEGFQTGGVWYHGTSSALLDSIMTLGLIRSGDRDLNEAAKSTMAAIGNQFTQAEEPVYLTQSRELAYYWAQQTVRERSVRFEGDEEPVVLAVTLGEEQLQKVKPDVGAASLLLMESGEQFMAHLAGIYSGCGFSAPDINLMQADRMEYLNKLGMAYLDQNITPSCISLVSG